MFTRIEIKNFKSIREATIKLHGINILIGPNNSGKSNLLDFISFYQSIYFMGVKDAFGPRPFQFRDVIFRGSDYLKNDISGKFVYRSLQDKEIEHFFSIGNIMSNSRRFDLQILKETLKFDTKKETFNNENNFSINKLTTQNDDLFEYVRDCRSIKKYQFSPKEIKKEREINLNPEIDKDKKDLPFLKYNGENLVEVLFFIRDYSITCFNSIIKDFQRVFPDISGISFVHLGEQRYGIKFVKKLSNKEWEFIGPQISDGMAITLAIFTLINSPKPPKYILFEELENGLNPNTLRLVLECISDSIKKKNIQFFITTHSPVLLELMNKSPEYVIVCEQKDGESIFTPLNEILIKFGDSYHFGESLFELWFNGLIGGL